MSPAIQSWLQVLMFAVVIAGAVVGALVYQTHYIDKRIEGLQLYIDAKIQGLEDKLEGQINGLRATLEVRLKAIEDRLDRIEKRMDKLEESSRAKV